MIERVNDRLIAWAHQVRGMGAGYSQSVLGRLQDNGGVVTPPRGDYVVPVDMDAQECEKAVCELDSELRDTVKVFYFYDFSTPDQKAKRLRISKATMYRRIKVAHLLLDHALFKAPLPSFAA